MRTGGQSAKRVDFGVLTGDHAANLLALTHALTGDSQAAHRLVGYAQTCRDPCTTGSTT